jgi:two-component system, OmpR family, sensor histidine kinase CssS
MRKFRDWISSFSLFKQFLMIITGYSIVFIWLFFAYSSSYIDKYADNQIFDLLREYHRDIVFSIRNDIDPKIFSSNEENGIAHVIYQDDRLLEYLGQAKYKSSILEYGYRQAQQAFLKEYTMQVAMADKTYYYCISVVDEFVVVSLADEGVGESARNSMFSTAFNVTFIIIGMLFLVLMLWIVGIIRPINQLKESMDKIKKGDRVDIRLSRHDEIGKLADAVLDMQNEIIRSEKTKEEIIHNISHDLKTPIATIKSYAESIIDGVYPYETLEKSVNVIYEHADRLEKKVYSLLFLNRFGYMLHEEKVKNDVRISEIIRKVILGAKVIRPEVVINLMLSDVLFTGTDESWRVVVENLMDNALRYAKTQIDVSLSTEYELCVANDGDPIDESTVDTMFKPYEKGRGGQFGLGLSIVKRVCSQFGYQVSASNTSNGVAFVIKPQVTNVNAKSIWKRKKDGQ